MYFTLLITVFITAAFLVVAAYVTAKLLGPRSYNPTKGEPYECGENLRRSGIGNDRIFYVGVGFWLGLRLAERSA